MADSRVPLRALRTLDSSSVGVTLPKGDLMLDGLLDENGDRTDDHKFHIQRIEDGVYILRAVDEGEIPPVTRPPDLPTDINE